MLKKLKYFLTILISCLFLSSFGGIYATWRFAEEPVNNVDKTQNIILSEFTWTPEEILPTVTPGQNFLDLYESILNNVKAGLNSSKDTLEIAVKKSNNHLVHCTQNVQGGNLKHLFITEASRELEFIMEYISDTNFNLYIYKEVDTLGAIGTTQIQVYKTFLLKTNGVWDGEVTQLGYATLQYFPNTNIPAIDVSTWTR